MPSSQESSSSKPDEQCTNAELQVRIDLLSFLSVTSLTKTDEDLYNDCKATAEEELSKRIKSSAAGKSPAGSWDKALCLAERRSRLGEEDDLLECLSTFGPLLKRSG
jgi:hypothetical protein